MPLHRARRPIATLYDAVKAGRLLWFKCDCWGCGKNVGLLSGEFLLRLGLRPFDFVLSIEKRVKCRACGCRGKAHVTIKWAKEAA